MGSVADPLLGKAYRCPSALGASNTIYPGRPHTTASPAQTFTLLSLLSPTMAQIRGTAGYHLGNQSPFGNGGRSDSTTNDPSPLDQLREQTSKIEDFLDTLSEPVKP